jgi:hypothetical protein
MNSILSRNLNIMYEAIKINYIVNLSSFVVSTNLVDRKLLNLQDYEIEYIDKQNNNTHLKMKIDEQLLKVKEEILLKVKITLTMK